MEKGVSVLAAAHGADNVFLPICKLCLLKASLVSLSEGLRSMEGFTLFKLHLGFSFSSSLLVGCVKLASCCRAPCIS